MSDVYARINEVTAMIGKGGIAKGRQNQQQGYAFRGIDDIYNALSNALTTAGLCIVPKVLERECIERTNAKGTALFYVTVKVEFSFVAVSDGSSHQVVMYGEAMDSGDKATNKAMSAAYKYACLQTFCIPTEGDNDADATSHEVRAQNHDLRISALDTLKAASSLEDMRRIYKEELNRDQRSALTDKDLEACKKLVEGKANA